jgi:tetratricopeptide (TPR) repeat protein
VAMASDRLAQLIQMYEDDPGDPFVSYGIALEHSKQEQFAEAVDWFDKTLELDSHYCYAYFHKAKTLMELGDQETACVVLEAGIRTAQEAGDDHARSEIEQFLESLNEDDDEAF